MILNDLFKEVIKKEGIVSVVTWADNDAHISNTWNSYLIVVEDKILMPAYAMIKTGKNIEKNPNVKITLGNKEVMGLMGMGTGFLLEGKASFAKEGELFDMMKAKCSFTNRVVIVDVTSMKQTV